MEKTFLFSKNRLAGSKYRRDVRQNQDKIFSEPIAVKQGLFMENFGRARCLHYSSSRLIKEI